MSLKGSMALVRGKALIGFYIISEKLYNLLEILTKLSSRAEEIFQTLFHRCDNEVLVAPSKTLDYNKAMNYIGVRIIVVQRKITCIIKFRKKNHSYRNDRSAAENVIKAFVVIE